MPTVQSRKMALEEIFALWEHVNCLMEYAARFDRISLSAQTLPVSQKKDDVSSKMEWFHNGWRLIEKRYLFIILLWNEVTRVFGMPLFIITAIGCVIIYVHFKNCAIQKRICTGCVTLQRNGLTVLQSVAIEKNNLCTKLIGSHYSVRIEPTIYFQSSSF